MRFRCLSSWQTILGRKGHDQKNAGIEVGICEIHGMHASSRNANDTWAGTKKEH